jgi:hypothetical protein
MKYELTKTDYSGETVINETEYSVNITLGLHPLDNFTPDFSKTITIVSNNSQTGFEVDTQRETAITSYLNTINS